MKTPHTGKAKNAPLNRCSECKPPGGLYVENFYFLFFIFYFFIYLFICFFCTWKIALKYKVKQSKNGKCSSNYNASPIDFETQISLRRKAPPKISPSKRAFEKCKPQGLFLQFYGSNNNKNINNNNISNDSDGDSDGDSNDY